MHFPLRPRRAWTQVAATAAFVLSLFIAGSASANPKYAGYVYDVNAGKALYADSADEERYPASLTKIMNLYIVFEELAAGRLSLSTPLSVSQYAAGRPPSKIGLRPGASIEVSDAIKALVTKSANDIAVVLAEHIEGSEAAYARRMTKTAKRLGMTSTVFRNANGLPDDRQHTTARDMATLGIAIQRDFPQYYGVFQTRVFHFGKRAYGNHNKLLGRVEGVDGIKTGYIRASGFNLVTSVRRDGKHLVAVVMGGNTGASRDRHMAELIERLLPKAQVGGTMPLIAWNEQRLSPPPLPNAKPTMATVYAARLLRKAEETGNANDPIGSEILAFVSDTRKSIGPLVAPANDPDTLTAVIAQASEAGLPAPEALDKTQVELEGSSTVIIASAPATSAGPAGAAGNAAHHPRVDAAFAIVGQAPSGTSSMADLLAAMERAQENRSVSASAGRGNGAGESASDRGRAHARVRQPAPAKTDSARGKRAEITGPAPMQVADSRSSRPVATSAVAAHDRSDWQIQLGAVGSPQEADALLSSAAETVPGLDAQPRVTVPVSTSRGTLYRARFAGFQSADDAAEACKRFANHNRPCWAVSM